MSTFFYFTGETFRDEFFMPNDADINHSLTDKTKIDVDFLSHRNSYKLTAETIPCNYFENNSIDFVLISTRPFR